MRKTEPSPVGNVISNNCFYGVKWDEKATAAVQTLAEAIKSEAHAAEVRANAVLSLCAIFRASNVTIEAMIKITDTPLPVNSGPSRD